VNDFSQDGVVGARKDLWNTMQRKFNPVLGRKGGDGGEECGEARGEKVWGRRTLLRRVVG
jgi:hypothetical protein